MNTVKSFWVGWGSLCVAGGGAYYFAKKSINADRVARFEAEQKRKRLQGSYEHAASNSTNSAGILTQVDGPKLSPATCDTKSEDNGDTEKSKCEPERPFRSLKGDRFS